MVIVRVVPSNPSFIHKGNHGFVLHLYFFAPLNSKVMMMIMMYALLDSIPIRNSLSSGGFLRRKKKQKQKNEKKMRGRDAKMTMIIGVFMQKYFYLDGVELLPLSPHTYSSRDPMKEKSFFFYKSGSDRSIKKGEWMSERIWFWV